MKTQSVFAYVMRITLTLLLIASVVAAAPALINQVTEPIIEQKTIEKTQKAIAVVLPGGYHEEITDFADDTGLVSKVYKGANGYAMEVTPAGFDNTITMMVGVDFEGKVLGISIISHTESAGLGAVAAGSNSAETDENCSESFSSAEESTFWAFTTNKYTATSFRHIRVLHFDGAP
jgi:electron transport complex protein RnfG